MHSLDFSGSLEAHQAQQLAAWVAVQAQALLAELAAEPSTRVQEPCLVFRPHWHPVCSVGGAPQLGAPDLLLDFYVDLRHHQLL